MEQVAAKAKVRKPVKRKRAIVTEVRFEFLIPDEVAEGKIDIYAWEKLKRLCRGLGKNGGVKVIPVIPARYMDPKP